MNRLHTVVSKERTTSDTSRPEVERLRNFILYVLSIDYHRNTRVSLSCTDREHYAAMNNYLNDLEEAHDRTHLTSTERAALAPYFWQYLHEPCKALAIPVECATVAILRFFHYQDKGARYKGSVYGILHTAGPEVLAQKLWLDRNIVMPRIISCGHERMDMIRGLNGVARMYFQSIDGTEGSAMTGSHTGGWNETQTMSYTLNERGRSYEKCRNDVVATTAECISLSPKHWATRIKACITDITQRRDVFPKRKEFSDAQGTWRGPEPVPEGTAAECHLWQRPYKWLLRPSVHLPDFFEHRPSKGSCEA